VSAGNIYIIIYEVESLWNNACAWGILWVEFMEGEFTNHRVYITGKSAWYLGILYH
jgi:hypothetical protein